MGPGEESGPHPFISGSLRSGAPKRERSSEEKEKGACETARSAGRRGNVSGNRDRVRSAWVVAPTYTVVSIANILTVPSAIRAA